MINIGYPYSCLEGIINRLSEAFWWGSNYTPLRNYKSIYCEDIHIELPAEFLDVIIQLEIQYQ
jgi:hypothetical protein